MLGRTATSPSRFSSGHGARHQAEIDHAGAKVKSEVESSSSEPPVLSVSDVIFDPSELEAGCKEMWEFLSEQDWEMILKQGERKCMQIQNGDGEE